MKTFKDSAGREWQLALTLGTAMTVRDRLGVDLLQPESGEPPLLTRLGTDEILLGEVLCVTLEDQFDKHGVTPEAIRGAFDGQTLLAAQQAFYEELVDFFRSRGRNDRAKAVAKQMDMINAAVSAVETKIDRLDVDEVIATAIDSGGGPMSGVSPVALDSVPTPPGPGSGG